MVATLFTVTVDVSTRCRTRCEEVRSLNDDIFRESLEPHSVGLFNGDGDVPRFAGVDISHGAGLAGVCSAYHCAVLAVARRNLRLLLHGHCLSWILHSSR